MESYSLHNSPLTPRRFQGCPIINKCMWSQEIIPNHNQKCFLAIQSCLELRWSVRSLKKHAVDHDKNWKSPWNMITNPWNMPLLLSATDRGGLHACTGPRTRLGYVGARLGLLLPGLIPPGLSVGSSHLDFAAADRIETFFSFYIWSTDYIKVYTILVFP